MAKPEPMASKAWFCSLSPISKMKVNDRDTFVRFIESLRRELISNPEKWGNTNLADFLEAIAAYTKDIHGYYMNTGQNGDIENPGWKVFADILTGASVYE